VGGLRGCERSVAILSYSTEMPSFSRIVAGALVATSTRARSTPARSARNVLHNVACQLLQFIHCCLCSRR